MAICVERLAAAPYRTRGTAPPQPSWPLKRTYPAVEIPSMFTRSIRGQMDGRSGSEGASAGTVSSSGLRDDALE
jgi:hypothetical protein